ncbi:hypothetical protein HYPSUDRAFT_207939 [Hypholoma sublateritium FD-334 SS-4]|uniref:Uncharacterized protein n=1 Tax=Hypholoma sublateritium (strain FD-334 SS-4) TaxID=945553 RepID=A0A0D2KL44_HYPSF|nr:hypothetical protein HYPSUDRAFT_207939 [Hypholoma sublateritium FD-334 SS-4]
MRGGALRMPASQTRRCVVFRLHPREEDSELIVPHVIPPIHPVADPPRHRPPASHSPGPSFLSGVLTRCPHVILPPIHRRPASCCSARGAPACGDPRRRALPPPSHHPPRCASRIHPRGVPRPAPRPTPSPSSRPPITLRRPPHLHPTSAAHTPAARLFRIPVATTQRASRFRTERRRPSPRSHRHAPTLALRGRSRFCASQRINRAPHPPHKNAHSARPPFPSALSTLSTKPRRHRSVVVALAGKIHAAPVMHARPTPPCVLDMARSDREFGQAATKVGGEGYAQQEYSQQQEYQQQQYEH